MTKQEALQLAKELNEEFLEKKIKVVVFAEDLVTIEQLEDKIAPSGAATLGDQP